MDVNLKVTELQESFSVEAGSQRYGDILRKTNVQARATELDTSSQVRRTKVSEENDGCDLWRSQNIEWRSRKLLPVDLRATYSTERTEVQEPKARLTRHLIKEGIVDFQFDSLPTINTVYI
ncbi:hypothetical protein BPAE_0358g00080 [Botrytis paeoniae]|uniref:Uncharacterized protein n=1 Tax=Botrytis paeoniae TaxID=278948 RepID=A0A4Z1F693_9HELO|nr:hypothetical protein BPAE_0358g00080 [Botrytis paeoniae]